jgi:hypothetical protein
MISALLETLSSTVARQEFEVVREAGVALCPAYGAGVMLAQKLRCGRRPPVPAHDRETANSAGFAAGVLLPLGDICPPA